jgi:epsin
MILLIISKNFAKGYSDIQIRVREATSNDPNTPPLNLLQAISNATHSQREFMDIFYILGKRLNDSGKNWRHVFKALVVLDYLLRHGSDAVVEYSKVNIHVIKTLKEFQYIDEEGRDQGMNGEAAL